jgi:hypothetical protein
MTVAKAEAVVAAAMRVSKVFTGYWALTALQVDDTLSFQVRRGDSNEGCTSLRIRNKLLSRETKDSSGRQD